MARPASLFLSFALVAAFALPASAAKSSGEDAALQALEASPCSLIEAVENGLAAVPGIVRKARLKHSHKPGEESIWFYKVVIFDSEGDRQVERFDAATCEAVALTLPTVPMPDAIATALVEVGGGFPVAGQLRFPGLEPVYRVVVLLPKTRMVVYVDGLSGEVLHVRKWNRRIDEAQDAAGEDDDDSSL
jgi:uncharacterized membrane protein YkoI